MLAPIIIFTHDRIEHLKLCIHSLQECINSNNTEIYIFLDAPCHEKYIENNNKIKLFVNQLAGFKKITLISNEYNVGILKNYEYAIKYIFDRYDKVIVLEDDILVSKKFINFMNNSLDYFENDDKCFAISSFMYPIDFSRTKTHVFKSKYFITWGLGLYKKKYISYEQAMKNWFFKLLNPLFAFKLLFRNPYIFNSMISQIFLKKTWYDVAVNFEFIRNNYYCIVPVTTLTKNIGLDGSGQNCDVNYNLQDFDLTNNQIIEYPDNFQFSKKEQKILNSELERYFKINLKQILYSYLLFFCIIFRFKKTNKYS